MNNTSQMRIHQHYTFNTTTNISTMECEHLGPAFTSAGIAVMGAIIVFSVSGNILVCTAIARFPRLRTISNCLVFSLAVSDIMVSATVVPFDIVYWMSFPTWPLGGYVCNLWNSLFFLFLTASVFNLLAISADRFIAIVFALRYKEFVNFKIVQIAIGSIWTYSFTTGIVLFVILVPPEDEFYTFDLHPALHGFLLVGNVLIPFIVMSGFYFKIYLIARDHAKRVDVIPIENAPRNGSNVRHLIGRELRTAKAFGIVVITFLLCWLPFEIINVTILIDEGVENCAIEITDTLSCWLAYLQIAANPIIYALANTQFRRAFRRIVFVNRSDLNLSTINSSHKEMERSFKKRTHGDSDNFDLLKEKTEGDHCTE